MKILVVSLQKFGNSKLELRHSVVDIINETRTGWRVVPMASVDGRTHIRKDEIERVTVESIGLDIVANVWALNEAETLSRDLLAYWKQRVKTETLKYLRKQNDVIKQTYKEASDI